MSYLTDYEEHMDYSYEYPTYETDVNIKVTFKTNSDEVMSCTIPLYTITLAENEEVQDYFDNLIGKISSYHTSIPEIQFLLDAVHEQPFMEKMFENNEELEVVEILDITEPTDEEVEEVQQVIRKKEILKNLINCNYREVATNLIYQYGRSEIAKMLLEHNADDTDGSFIKNGKLSLVRHLIYEQLNTFLSNSEVANQIREHLENKLYYKLEMLQKQQLEKKLDIKHDTC